MSWRTQWRKCRHCGGGYRNARAMHQHVRTAHPRTRAVPLTGHFVRYARMNVPVTPLVEGTEPQPYTYVLEQMRTQMEELTGAPPVLQGPRTATEIVLREQEARFPVLGADQRKFLATRLLEHAYRKLILGSWTGMRWIETHFANENSHEE